MFLNVVMLLYVVDELLIDDYVDDVDVIQNDIDQNFVHLNQKLIMIHHLINLVLMILQMNQLMMNYVHHQYFHLWKQRFQ